MILCLPALPGHWYRIVAKLTPFLPPLRARYRRVNEHRTHLAYSSVVSLGMMVEEAKAGPPGMKQPQHHRGRSVVGRVLVVG